MFDYTDDIQGTVYEYGTPEYDEFLPEAKRMPGSRAVIIVDVYKVGSVSTTQISDFPGY